MCKDKTEVKKETLCVSIYPLHSFEVEKQTLLLVVPRTGTHASGTFVAQSVKLRVHLVDPPSALLCLRLNHPHPPWTLERKVRSLNVPL